MMGKNAGCAPAFPPNHQLRAGLFLGVSCNLEHCAQALPSDRKRIPMEGADVVFREVDEHRTMRGDIAGARRQEGQFEPGRNRVRYKKAVRLTG